MASPDNSSFQDLKRQQEDLNCNLYSLRAETDKLHRQSTKIEGQLANARADHQVSDVLDANTVLLAPREMATDLESGFDPDELYKSQGSGSVRRRKTWYKKRYQLKQLRRQLENRRQEEREVADRMLDVNARLSVIAGFWGMRRNMLLHQMDDFTALDDFTEVDNTYPSADGLSIPPGASYIDQADEASRTAHFSSHDMRQIDGEEIDGRHSHHASRSRECCAGQYLVSLKPTTPEDSTSHVYVHEFRDRHTLQQSERYKSILQSMSAAGAREKSPPPPYHEVDTISNASTVCPAASPDSAKIWRRGRLRGGAAEFVPGEWRKAIRGVTTAKAKIDEPDADVKQRFARVKRSNGSMRLRRSYSSSALSMLAY